MTDFKFRWLKLPEVAGLTGKTAALASEMFSRADMDGTRVYGSQVKLAEKLGTTERTVRRAQERLESLGLITAVGNRGSGRSGKSTEWRLTMPPNTGHLDSGIPDISREIPDMNTGHPELNTGHSCPEYRTSVTGIPDTSVRPIDPLPDPGTKPGSVVEGNTSVVGVLPPVESKATPGREPLGSLSQGEDIGDVRPTVQPPPHNTDARERRDGQPPTESEAHMNNPTDPFSTPMVVHVSADDPFAVALNATAHVPEVRSQPEAFAHLGDPREWTWGNHDWMTPESP